MPKLYLFIACLLIVGCGVKGLPVAPEAKPTPAQPLQLNCSSYDPDCDKEDPDYVPQGKNGKYPETEEE